jgi:hypothetical protein
MDHGNHLDAIIARTVVYAVLNSIIIVLGYLSPSFCGSSITENVVKVGNCVTTAHLKSFLLVLYITPLAFTLAVFPIIQPLSRHVLLALNLSRSDNWARNMWWDWWGSWIFIGGPLGRWIIGIVIGFWIRRGRRGIEGGGVMVEKGYGRLVGVVAAAMLFSLFSGVSTTSWPDSCNTDLIFVFAILRPWELRVHGRCWPETRP